MINIINSQSLNHVSPFPLSVSHSVDANRRGAGCGGQDRAHPPRREHERRSERPEEQQARRYHPPRAQLQLRLTQRPQESHNCTVVAV